jgi:HEAT repeat protein
MACLVQGVTYEHSSIVRVQAVEGLQDHGGEASLRWIRQAVHDEDAAVRFAALMALGQRQDRVAESAIRRLATQGQASDRIAAIYALHRLGDASRTADLAAYLIDSPDLATRRHAAMVLGYLGEPGAVRLLARVMREDDPGLRANALESMLMLGADEARATLYANAFSGVGAEEAFAVMALGRLRDRALSDLYRQKVDTAFHMETKLAAARALGMLGDDYGLAVAREALTFQTSKSEKNDPAVNRTFRVRQMGAVALGEIGESVAVPDLVRLMVEADDPRLEIAAATAILAILGDPPSSDGTPFDTIRESASAAGMQLGVAGATHPPAFAIGGRS